jgi:tRNA threonylcarbamoyl adenosine modification protein YeaZ
MILFIDTTDNDVAEVALFDGRKTLSEKFASLPHGEDFAALIKKFLKTKKISLKDIDKIGVKTGPGFFSRLRTGVVAANALAFALNIKIVPVVGKIDYKKIVKAIGTDTVAPAYGRGPSITRPKHKK